MREDVNGAIGASINRINGANGVTGVNGVNGFAGVNGVNGVNGIAVSRRQRRQRIHGVNSLYGVNQNYVLPMDITVGRSSFSLAPSLGNALRIAGSASPVVPSC